MGRIIHFDHFELRPDERALLDRGEPVRLGGRAFDILLALVERRERVVEFDELLDVVWPGLAVEEGNLSVQVSGLRKILGAKAITTVRGKGYRFTAPLRESTTSDTNASWLTRWPQAGAVVCVAQASSGVHASQPPWSLQAGERVPASGTGAPSLVFDSVQPAVAAALRALRSAGPEAGPRIGIAAIDAMGGTDATTIADRQARALASHAAAGELLLTADLATEFVAGVHGDVEDLGDLQLDCGTLRSFCVREAATAQTPALDAPPPLNAQAGLRPSIAVLPFDDGTRDDPDDILGDALADDAIASLSRLPELSVVSGLSSRRLRRYGLERSQAASLLAADFLLAGSYQHGTTHVQVRLLLQDANSGEVLCVIAMEAGLREAFDPTESLGNRIATQVAQAIFARAFALSRTRPLPEMQNYALLMGAVGLMHRAAPNEFARAQAMLQHLIQRPGCRGVASAWLAKWHVLRVVQGWSPDASVDAGLALDLVQRSLDEDSRDALALAIGGLVHAYLRKDLHAAGALYDEAIDANHSEPLAWLFSATRLAWLGEGPQAEKAGERALRLSPIDPMKYFFDSLAATAALANGSWARSEALCRRSLRGNRTHASTWRTLAYALVMLERMDEARDAVQRLRLIEPGFTVGRFKERFPGRDGPMAMPWAEALKAAGLPA